MKEKQSQTELSTVELIAAIRGEWGTTCDFCGQDKPVNQIEPDEAGTWVCHDCLKRWGEM